MSELGPKSEAGDSREPATSLRVLILEHVEADAELCLQALRNGGFEVRGDLVQTPEEFADRLRAQDYDVVLADYRLPQWTGMEALAQLQQMGKDIPFLLVTGALGEEAAVECVKQGVIDFVLKERLVRLPVAVRRALKESALREERRRGEEALREREARYRVLAETATDAIVTINSESRILFLNAAAESIFGYARAEMLGQDLTMLMPEYLREVHKTGLKRYLGTGRKHLNWESVEITGLHKSGAEIPVEVSFGEFFAEGERMFTGIIRDITERRRAQEALREANEKLAARVKELEQNTREVTLVNKMGELLQTCVTPPEAYAVISQSVQQLFPGEAGAVCVLNASRVIAEAVAVWGNSLSGEPVFAPEQCWAFRRGRAHLVDGPHSGPRCGHLSQPPPTSSLCVPMIAQGEALGVLLLQSNPAGPAQPDGHSDRREGLTEAHQSLAVNVAEHIALALANLRLREALQDQSIRDALTGLHNRRYLEESFEREIRRAVRKQSPLGVIMFDLDHFKQFNDTYGHEAGDLLLRELGHFLQSRTRREDIACRYGGEEFLVILPEAWLEVTQKRAEQLRAEVKELKVQCRGQSLRGVTLSSGVAVFPEHGSTANTLLHAADQALYRAKAQGRDRVVVAESLTEQDQAPPPPAFAAPPHGPPK